MNFKSIIDQQILLDKAIKEAEPLVKEERQKSGKPTEEKPTEDPNGLNKP